MPFTGTTGPGLRATADGLRCCSISPRKLRARRLGAREGFTRTFPNAYTQVLFSGKYRQVVEGRDRQVQRGRTYPARLAEPPLKERMEGHSVFPTTGQTAVCKEDTDAVCSTYSPAPAVKALCLLVLKR